MNEVTMLERELELARDIEELREALAESRKTRRAIPKPSEALEEAQQAHDDAEAKVERLKVEKADAENLLASLNGRLDAGDENVSVDDIVQAEKAGERAGRLLKPAEQALQEAKRVLKPLQADEHLAHLAADSLEAISHVPVVVYKTPAEAPEIEPLIVVTQTAPTEAYGTLEANGSVRLTAKGCEVDTKALKAAMEDTGSEVSVTSTGIVFDRAAWATPRLHQPSVHALSEYMSTMQQAWKAQVAGGNNAQRLIEAGYSVEAVKVAWNGLMHRAGEQITVTDTGKAEGEAVFHIAAQHERGDSLPVEDLKAEITSLVDTFRSETIGGISEAGEIVNAELVEVSEYRGNKAPWDNSELFRHLGEVVPPITAECVLKVSYSFQPAEEV